ncbi:SufD family Fe-S cluster assembly protein [Leptospira sp. 2 VSF19]|uniref:SufD family Fe-S cluster assembly protein n=1 Tax=Leptospira soteropolitanensis TaxID=2950025 RepID=A0AAW5VGZ3_9LEPT|nr:SufD family Fe-S cluster assembly protein [Leptospira soteropolitanensis]MCW7493273.1 SufD family Fe-S cluster assembly protein [Leptospira soteropolitanensis]MCW7500658.1 SufD family Fe-S cluster assembly protein [Leptospira soteropolitanensis]MCW7523123.1 SufD family Fe-S cluster assembly protein [Leptospira soteropolitanensis]MCW7526770.1 SufD family Fe-S cluster assembly protein [Leptospira soteropolitanensis]MCW7530841.1 SufD family Fe-S cluster assembly protein [Leptospira soteropolit
MNSSLEKNRLVLSKEKHISFKNSLLEIWNQLEIPKDSEESWRKFPIGSVDWKELQFDPKEISTTNTSAAKENKDSTLDEETIESILADILKYTPKEYFAFLSLVTAPKYEIFLLEEGESFFSFAEEGDKPNHTVRIFYLQKGRTNKTQIQLQNIHDSENLHMCSALDFFISEDSSYLEILDMETSDLDLYRFRNICILSHSDSHTKYHYYPIGGFRSKLFLDAHLLGKGAEVTVDGVSALGGRNLKDLDMEMFHHADFTTSKISYKAIVTDKSHHIFTGNLIIPPNLKKVTAHQESFNLSLNKKARAEANPKLEVLAEDVSCTHGATVGDIDEEQYFYLLSRGLTPEESKSLLVTAFYGETIHSIGFSEEIKLSLESRIREILVGAK